MNAIMGTPGTFAAAGGATTPVVGIIMGSDSDLPKMKPAAEVRIIDNHYFSQDIMTLLLLLFPHAVDTLSIPLYVIHKKYTSDNKYLIKI